MAGTIWIPEAEDLRAVGSSNTMDGLGGPRATAHVTVSNPGSFDAMHGVLTNKKSEPHVLYDMKGDRLGQYFALDRSARALMGGDGSPYPIGHNRHGLVNIQVEICWDPADGDLTLHDLWAQDRPNWQAFLRAVRSWGIDDRFIYRTARSSGDKAAVERSVATWWGSSGGGCWWGHCHYDEAETHWDPGPLDVARFFGGDTMALTTDDLKKIWNFDVIPTRWSTTDDATNPTWGVAGFFGYLGTWVLTARDNTAAIIKTLAAHGTTLAAIAADTAAARKAAEQAVAGVADLKATVAAMQGADAAAIEAAVEAGLQKMIDSVTNTTVLTVDGGSPAEEPERPAGLMGPAGASRAQGTGSGKAKD